MWRQRHRRAVPSRWCVLVDDVAPDCTITTQVRDGDRIVIDAERRVMDAPDVDEAEWARRRAEWQEPPLKAKQGTLYKYIKNVSSASLGCVTDL